MSGAAATLRLGPQACGTLVEAAAREWLCADGLGGYAMGTVAGLRTRRYHGLLVTSGAVPGERRLGLAALDAVLVLGDARLRLATDEWTGGALDPAGHVHLVGFALVDGVPRWRWQVGGVVVERELACLHGRPGVAVVHRIRAAPGPVALELAALCTWRDVHGERRAGPDPDVAATADGFTFEGRYRVAGSGYVPGGAWFRGVWLREEAARGLPAEEDVWCAGGFRVELAPGEAHAVTAWADDLAAPAPDGVAVVAAARARAAAAAERAGARDTADRLLAHAADQVVIETPTGPTVVAGYPWFGEWSRDVLTAYEGLLLATGRADDGRRLLARLAGRVSEGMLANTADGGAPVWNTADAALWLAHAVGRHVAATGDDDLAAELLPALDDVVDGYRRGTRFGIRAGADGLLRQGAAGEALTWMDARSDGRPVTARAGCALELQALWVEALGATAALRRRVGRDAHDLDGAGATARAALATRFVRADGLLRDVVDGPTGDDDALRPNGLLACSLPHVRLAAPRHVEACRDALLTPLGPRSLAPADPAYRGRHRGDQRARDAAYHQGTVWPWLIGPYVEAARAQGIACERALDGLLAHLGDAGLGSVSETAEGDAPHVATGCPFQAWSVAELIRARRIAGGTP